MRKCWREKVPREEKKNTFLNPFLKAQVTDLQWPCYQL